VARKTTPAFGNTFGGWQQLSRVRRGADDGVVTALPTQDPEVNRVPGELPQLRAGVEYEHAIERVALDVSVTSARQDLLGTVKAFSINLMPLEGISLA
jgi:hypothetical protein